MLTPQQQLDIIRAFQNDDTVLYRHREYAVIPDEWAKASVGHQFNFNKLEYRVQLKPKKLEDKIASLKADLAAISAAIDEVK